MTSDQRGLRKAGRKARHTMSAFDRQESSDMIADHVNRAHWFQRSACVGCYLPTTDEVNTWEIIARAWRMKKRVFSPIVKKNRQMVFRELTPDTTLRPGILGLLEPSDGEYVPARTLDVVITPVVAFDNDGHRIGMGGGYFDRTFAFTRHRSQWQHPRLVGVAFACQKVREIQPNPWDIRVFTVVTEETPLASTA